MSTTNTETLVLYKNAKLYNGSRYKVFQGRPNFYYDDWLDDNSNGKLTKIVYYKSITEPILLLEDLPVMDAYTYGSLTAMGKKYYIFIDRVTTDQNGRTTISYSVDWWATEWSNVSITAAHLTRRTTKPDYMKQPYSSIIPELKSNVTIAQDYCIMATYIPSTGTEEPSYISTVVIPGNEQNWNAVYQGYWYQDLGIAGSDVKDCFIVPLFTYNDFYDAQSTIKVYVVSSDRQTPSEWIAGGTQDGFDNAYYERFGDLVPTNGMYVYNVKYAKWYQAVEQGSIHGVRYEWHEISNPITTTTQYYEWIGSIRNNDEVKYLQSVFGVIQYPKLKILNVDIYTDDKVTMGIADWNNDSVWVCPYGRHIDYFKVVLLVGASHIMLKFTEYSQTSGFNDIDNVIGVGFTYDCRHPPLFVDNYKDYVLKNRDYDIQMRKIQSDKQLYQSVFSTAENAGFGMAFGKEVGMAAATIGGIIETFGTFAINSFFDPKIQKQYDKRYGLMTDNMSVIGDSIVYALNPNFGYLFVYRYDLDASTSIIMDKDIAKNGYYCDEFTDNLSALIVANAKIQADNVTVEGAVPLDCKHQIVYRLQNGVEFI